MILKRLIGLALFLAGLLLAGCSTFTEYIEPLHPDKTNTADIDGYIGELNDIYDSIEGEDLKGLITLVMSEQTCGFLSKEIVDNERLKDIETAAVLFLPDDIDYVMESFFDLAGNKSKYSALYTASVKEPSESTDVSVSTIYLIVEVGKDNINIKPYKVYAFKTCFVQPYVGESMQASFRKHAYYYQNTLDQ